MLADLFGVLPTPRVLHDLTRRLAEETETVVQVWRARPEGFSIELSWPAEAPAVPGVVDAATLDADAGGRGLRLIQDDLQTHGAITLTATEGPG